MMVTYASFIFRCVSILLAVSAALGSRLGLKPEVEGSLQEWSNFVRDSFKNEHSTTHQPSSTEVADGAEKRTGTSRPLVGILAQAVAGETHAKGEELYKNKAYIASSYIKWVEASGARAVPIVYTWPEEEIVRRFKAVNALILPGGSTDLCNGGYTNVTNMLLRMAIEANDKGDFFPVFGTCLGFEQLVVHFAEDCNAMDGGLDSENLPSPLLPTPKAASSRLFSSPGTSASSTMFQLVKSNAPIAMENHGNGISVDHWNQNENLKNFFDLLTYSFDRKGKAYVSTMEAKNYPIYGVQWHPEKNNFVWTHELDVPHGEEAILLSQALANFFIHEARKNSHQPVSAQEELDILIYNYSPSYTYKTWPEIHFDQIYFFEKNEVPLN